eukprot:TRINITY_DN73261_c0_g1_i1.p1 TRINITY_DN73261_c0_g1~~TRINITY_DN73261_c0_g1_i1.p1  ORF type:complete len:423 (-),score=86.22 TRINITY_DN73261_c0_g1_i1:222-1490(-)
MASDTEEDGVDAEVVEAGRVKRASDLTGKPKARYIQLLKWHERMYMFGVCNMLLTVVIALRLPQFFWVWHVAKTLFLLSWRYVRFKRMNCELYLLDFCYFVSYLTTLGCFWALARHVVFGHGVGPWDAELFKIGFTFANGVLAWSVIIFRNSLVFHEVDHLTSVFIHLSPAILFWCMRWGAGFGPALIESRWPDMFDICAGTDLTRVGMNVSMSITILGQRMVDWSDDCPGAWQSFVWPPALFYLVFWAIPYYMFLFWCFASRIERTGKETLYAFVVKDPLKSAFIRRFPQRCWPLAYMFQHFLMVLGFGILTFVFWHSFALNTLFLFCMVMVAVYNGSTFMFRNFGLRFADRLLMEHEVTVMVDDLEESSSGEDASATEEEKYVEGNAPAVALALDPQLRSRTAPLLLPGAGLAPAPLLST